MKAPPPVIDASAVMSPDSPASSVNAWPPVLTSDLNRMSPNSVPVVSIRTLASPPDNVTAFVNVTSSSVVVIFAAVVNVPALSAPNVTAPPASISPASAIVVVFPASISIVLPVAMDSLIPIVPAVS